MLLVGVEKRVHARSPKTRCRPRVATTNNWVRLAPQEAKSLQKKALIELNAVK
jgi:hypothetical protein